MHDVIIVGAGPAGLTTAYKLLQNKPGLRVLILEKDPQYVGGISRTEKYNGYRFDIGGHRFFSKSEEIMRLWREILPDDFIQRPRVSRIYYGKKFYSYPLRAFEAFRNMGPFLSTYCVMSYAYARAFPIKNPTSFHAWVRNQFGEKLFSIFFKTYTEKVWGMSCDDISADWAAQRIKGLNLASAIINALSNSMGLKKGLKKDKVVKTLISSFDYPRMGPGMMWEAAAAKVKAMGGEILMGQDVTKFVRNGPDDWQVQTAKGESYSGKAIVSSAPLRDVVNAVEPRPVSAEQANLLKYRDFITIAIMLKKPPTFDDNWIYIHDPAVKVGRVQNFTSWSPEMVPEAGLGCLGLEYFCFAGDNLWDSSDADLITLAKKELEYIGIANHEDVIDAAVVRQPKAYPVYDKDYKTATEAIVKEFTEKYPEFYFVGRNGMHKYNNQDHAMMTGILTAENIIAGKRVYDVWDVNEDAEYHEDITDRQKALASVHKVPIQ